MRTKIKSNNIWIIILLSFYLSACDVADTVVNNTPAGKRDYIWSRDSVEYGDLEGPIEMYSMWGSSPNDVWGASFRAADLRNSFWHYDGKKWSRAIFDTPLSIHGNGSIEIGGVWGTAQNNVWGFGLRQHSNPEWFEPFVMKYDGTTWTEVLGDKNNMPFGFHRIRAIDENNFWITASGNITNYSNGVWKRYSIEKLTAYAVSVIGSNVYATAYYAGKNTLYLLKKQVDFFIKIDSTDLFHGKFGVNGLDVISDEIYSYGYDGIYKAQIVNGEIDINSWKNCVHVYDGGLYYATINSVKDICIVGWSKDLYHYNGTDWQAIEIDVSRYGNISGLEGIWGDGKELFICDPYEGIVYHGK